MKSVIMIFTFILLICACKKSGQTTNTIDCSGSAKSFAVDINPILQSHCNDDAGCHISGNKNGPGPLLTYSQIFNARTLIH